MENISPTKDKPPSCAVSISDSCLEELKKADIHIKEEDTLYAIIPIFNPKGYNTRYNLYYDFMNRLESYKKINKSKLEVYVIECAFANRPFVVTEKCNRRHIQVRSCSELWIKENLINLAIQHLPQSWKYVAWIDADISFSNWNWIDDTIKSLQHFDVVQLFQTAVDLGPEKEVIKSYNGFAYLYKKEHRLMFESKDKQSEFKKKRKYEVAHPGYAWAIKKRPFNNIGGLFDVGILGSSDHHMAMAFIGKVMDSVHKKMHPNYLERLNQYQQLCNEYISGNLGYVSGSIIHYWHGCKKKRYYVDRWAILIKNKYDPDTDLKREWTGVYALSLYNRRQRDLARDIQTYFALRNEDSIDNDT